MQEQVSSGPFTRLNCRALFYTVRIAHEKFKLDQFLNAVGGTRPARETGFVICGVRDQKNDYHLHAEWRVREADVRLELNFYQGPREPVEAEEPPFAKEFVGWLGQFFINENTTAHVHCDFVFSPEFKESKFPLPLRTTVGSVTTELDSISLRIPTEPEGIERISVFLRKETLRSEAIATRKITFSSFDPLGDITSLASIVNWFVTEKVGP